MSQCLYAQTIHGVLASKSNSRRLVYWRGKSRLIKSASALRWMKDAKMQMPIARGGVLCTLDVRLIAVVYYPTKRNDLDVGLLMDALEANGIIKNDRQIVEIQARKRWDKEKPRVEVRLEAVDQD